MKLHQLRDYPAIAEKGCIRAAAKHMGIAQPALSRSIRDLEQEVGTPLLERHPGGAVLTELGKTFARRSGAAYQELRRALEELQQLQGVMQGEVAICVSSPVTCGTPAQHVVPIRQAISESKAAYH